MELRRKGKEEKDAESCMGRGVALERVGREASLTRSQVSRDLQGERERVVQKAEERIFHQRQQTVNAKPGLC